MSILQYLPYDVLLYLFGHLDRDTLLNASLTNRAFNELASRWLYARVTVTFSSKIRVFDWKESVPNSFEAFTRRPRLRELVRSVVITCTRWDRASQKEHADLCCRELALLYHLESITIRPHLSGHIIDLLVNSISSPLRLRELRWTYQPIPLGIQARLQMSLHLFKKFANACHFVYVDLFKEEDVGEVLRSIAPVCAITSFWLPYLIVDDAILSLPRLQQLEGGKLPNTLPDLCSSLSTATNLTHLKFRLNMTQFQFEGLLPNQIGLTKLEKLTILLHAQRPTFNEGVLLAIVDNLARKSRLKTLGFATRNARPPVLSAQKLIIHVIQTHNGSLEKLKLPLFTVSKVAMIRLLHGLPRLTHLWIAVTESSRGWIPDVLSVSQSLERLRLYGAGNWIINYARSLLLQTTQNLSKIKACRPCALGVIDKETWESYWEYDEELKCAVRRVYGPVAVEITTVSDPWGVKRRNRETDNVPEEEAMHVDGSV